MKKITFTLASALMLLSTAEAESLIFKNSCMISEIKNIGLNTHDVQVRIHLIKDWLKKNAKQCNDTHLKTINSNRGSWFGHADTAELHMLLDALYESKISGNPGFQIENIPIEAKTTPAGSSSFRTSTRPTPIVVTPAPIVIPQGEDGNNISALMAASQAMQGSALGKPVLSGK